MTDAKTIHSSQTPTSERLEEVLRPGVEPIRRRRYLDCVGDGDRERVRRDQSVFRSRALPVIYERLWRPVISRLFFGKELGEPEERRMVLEMLRLAPGDSVLDVGCGTGNYTRHLAREARDGLAVGLDASKPMIASAARRGGGANLAYLRGDACELPFRDATFDAVCSVGVVHMLGEPMKALAEMVRVLAPGGRLVVVASYEDEAIPLAKRQMKTFGKDELTGFLRGEGLAEIEQKVVERAQFVAARKAAEGGDDGR